MKQLVLPDVLDHGLLVVIVGMAVGNDSAANQRYYCRPGNHFWRAMRELGLVPEDFDEHKWQSLPHHGIGLTDLIKDETGVDANVRNPSSDDVETFLEKMQNFKPHLIAFNGKKTYEKFYKQYDRSRRQIFWLEDRLFQLASTSPSNNKQWYQNGVWLPPDNWKLMAERVEKLKTS